MRNIVNTFFTGLVVLFLASSVFRPVIAQGRVSTTTPAGTQAVVSTGWVTDAETTVVGKTANRIGAFLDWTLQTYYWANVVPGQPSPLASAWVSIRDVVYAFLILMVLIAAFVFVTTRGRNLKVKEFIPRFIAIVLLIAFSYSLLQIIYQLTDLIQGFFLRLSNGSIISSKDLLSISFDYTSFQGFRRTGDQLNESGEISLFLIRATSATYFAMAGILLIRKIIMWFFIILSPIFPLLILFNPIRNTAKIWVGEFLRWVLYAPIFTVLLSGLVIIWKASTPTTSGIPLDFAFGTEAGLYPTAVNILIGGPGQVISIENSVNNPGTFALYVVSLLMLWVVIILPFILLKILIDVFKSYPLQEGVYQLFKSSSGLYNRFLSSPGPVIIPPSSTRSTGVERAIPSYQSSTSSETSRYSTSRQTYTQKDTESMRLINMTIPTIRDIAKFEGQTQQITNIQNTLMGVARPETMTSAEDRHHYSYVRTRLLHDKEQGSSVAATILKAAETVTSGSTLDTFPTVNPVQSVSIDDYEDVKKTWIANYQKINPPKSKEGAQMKREDWIKQELKDVEELINLLVSRDKEKGREGMSKASKILPILLVGGFSQTEVIAYLKSKEEACKSVLEKLAEVKDEEFVDVEAKQQLSSKELHVETKVEPEKNNFSSLEVSNLKQDS